MGGRREYQFSPRLIDNVKSRTLRTGRKTSSCWLTTEGRKEGRKEKLNGPWELRKPAAIYLSTFCIPWLFRLFILCQEFPSSINDIDGLHHHQTLLLVLQKSFSRIMRYCSLPLPVLLYNSR